MTQEEAISVIKAEIGQFINDEKWKNALALAVSALQEQEAKAQLSAEGTTNLQPTCNKLATDCISRRAAIDAVGHITSSMSVCVTTDECHGMKRMQRQAVIELANLPSAQPERKNGKWIGKSGSLHYCSECGWALMDNENGEPPYMGIDYHRENPERWTCCPGWNEWLMNFCPNCGADMRGGQEC